MLILVRVALVLILASPPIAALILYFLRRRLSPVVDAYGSSEAGDVTDENGRWRSVGRLLDVWRARMGSRKGY